MDDIYAVCAELQRMGHVILRPPRDGHMAFVKTPDGETAPCTCTALPTRSTAEGEGTMAGLVQQARSPAGRGWGVLAEQSSRDRTVLCFPCSCKQLSANCRVEMQLEVMQLLSTVRQVRRSSCCRLAARSRCGQRPSLLLFLLFLLLLSLLGGGGGRLL